MIADLEQSAWLEAVELASDDRLPLPLSLRNRLDWAAPTSSLPLLATIGPEGEVGIRPLSDRQSEMKVLQAVLSDAEPANRASLALVAMALYCKVSLQPDGRLRLPPLLAKHLREPPGNSIWVGVYGNDLTLWSEKAWALVVDRQAAALRQAMAVLRKTPKDDDDIASS